MATITVDEVLAIHDRLRFLIGLLEAVARTAARDVVTARGPIVRGLAPALHPTLPSPL